MPLTEERLAQMAVHNEWNHRSETARKRYHREEYALQVQLERLQDQYAAEMEEIGSCPCLRCAHIDGSGDAE